MKLKVLADGPIVIESKGKAEITKNGVEKTVKGSTVALCRCGQSKNTPFCDGSHVKANFKADPAEINIE